MNIIATPVREQERIVILDSLRGIAILGILLMNIPHFGLPSAVINDPSLLHEQGTINYTIWYMVSWIPEGTQRALFSMLFGAGILLFIGGKEKKGGGMMPADYFFRRQLWLMVFSLVDVFILLWYGDILLDYALLGMIMFAFRNLPPKRLLIGAAFCFVFMLARENRDLYLKKEKIHFGEIAAAIDTTKTKLTFLQQEQLAAMNSFREKNTVEAKLKEREESIVRTTESYRTLYEYRTGEYLDTLVHYLFFGIWDVLLFMFLGMAFFKMGILTGQASVKTYVLMTVIGLGAGLVISYFRLQAIIDSKFDGYAYTRTTVFSFYELSRTFRSIGFLGLIMLLFKSGVFKWFFALFRPVGQMAFTNYLMQSLICGLIFYGIGWGWYGRLERHEIYIVLAVVWLFQILYSHLWLHFFRFGPLEWAWRSLTYWKRQPMRRFNKNERNEL